jgi:hypothetical protein
MHGRSPSASGRKHSFANLTETDTSLRFKHLGTKSTGLRVADTKVCLREDFMMTLLRDLSYALRQLRKSPGFMVVSVATLALGIGANTAIFTLVHAILVQPLPVKNPSQLYRLGSQEVNCCVIGGLQDVWDVYSNSLYQHIRKQTPPAITSHCWVSQPLLDA